MEASSSNNISTYQTSTTYDIVEVLWSNKTLSVAKDSAVRLVLLYGIFMLLMLVLIPADDGTETKKEKHHNDDNNVKQKSKTNSCAYNAHTHCSRIRDERMDQEY